MEDEILVKVLFKIYVSALNSVIENFNNNVSMAELL